MRWAEYITHMGINGIHIGIWWEDQKERNRQEDKDAGGRIILKLM
jgi:hypothetical protein